MSNESEAAKTAGMYNVNNPDHHKVQVEEFVIIRQDEEHVWIQNAEGEGAEFMDSLFGDAIRTFFNKHI